MSAKELLSKEYGRTMELTNQLLHKIKPFETKIKEGTGDYGDAGSLARVNDMLRQINEFLK